MEEPNSEQMQQFREMAANLTPKQIEDLKKDEPAIGHIEPLHYNAGADQSPHNETKKVGGRRIANSSNEEGQTKTERLADQYRRQQFAGRMEKMKKDLKGRLAIEKVTGASGGVGVRRIRSAQDEEQLSRIRAELALPTNPEETEAEDQKLQLWIDKREEVDRLADAEGKGIEPKVKETIVGLNVLGYNTTQSCEGHGGPKEYAKPWIRIAAPDMPVYRFAGQEGIFQKVAQKFNTTVEAVQRAEDEAAWREAMNESGQAGESAEYIQWREANQALSKRLDSLLEEFYSNRHVEPGVKLCVVENPEGDIELHHGTQEYPALPDDMTDDDKANISRQLSACQAELAAFTRFLRDKFLAG